MGSFLDEEVPDGLYFINAPEARTRREATAHCLANLSFTELEPPFGRQAAEVLHQIVHPFSDGSIVDRKIVLQDDGRVRKSVRLNRSDLLAERRSLELIGQATTVPVPCVYAHYRSKEFEHLVVEKMSGITLEKTWPQLSRHEREDIAGQVVSYINQLRQLQCSSINSALLDRKPLAKGLCNAFDLSMERIKQLHQSEVVVDYIRKRCAVLEDVPNVFTHGDLDWSNILVLGNRVCGIVDLESSGYFPPFWEWVMVKRMSRAQPAGSWFCLLEERLGRDRPSAWDGMWEVEKLILALERHSGWALQPDDRVEHQVKGWEEVRHILGVDLGPLPRVTYTATMMANPWWLDRLPE